jgi:ABC-type oligopeptide transport system ATPase subunit
MHQKCLYDVRNYYKAISINEICIVQHKLISELISFLFVILSLVVRNILKSLQKKLSIHVVVWSFHYLETVTYTSRMSIVGKYKLTTSENFEEFMKVSIYKFVIFVNPVKLLFPLLNKL